MPKPPYFPQAYPFSCVPACLRMVLASFDCEKSESEIRSLCNCDETGTSPSNAVKVAVEFGFDARLANLTFEELEDLISGNITPIVFIKVIENLNYSHAVVVYKISRGEVFVLDPEIGDHKLKINLFTEIWSRGLTIIVMRK